ncbi:MAG: hypothetical protein HQM09_10720 [Candidatus Riflebacteria bacterium]|nr:hypothetical protein [Candidatus Riflebacteria bacterium]
MTRKPFFVGLMLAFAVFTVLFAAEQATDSFFIPATSPETTITSDSMTIKKGAVTLIGNVRAISGDKILTSGKATLWRNPDRLLASITPRLYQKESIDAKQSTRESTLDALNILWEQSLDRISASPAVTLKIDEQTWDHATHTWVVISADSLEGFRNSNKLNFQGNVRIRDQERSGQGNRLDYDKASSTAILSGSARVEKDEWSPKEKRVVKRILTGERIVYDLASKTAESE